MCLAGAVVASLSLTGEPFNCHANISLTKFSKIQWKHLGETQTLRMHVVYYEQVFFYFGFTICEKLQVTVSGRSLPAAVNREVSTRPQRIDAQSLNLYVELRPIYTEQKRT